VGSNQFAPIPISDEPSCVEQALLNLELPDLDFNVPPIQGCSKERCVEVAEAWLLAHYSVYRVRQMLEYMAGHNAQKRSAMWSSRLTAKEGGAVRPSDPPDLYTKYRFAAGFGGCEQ